MFVFEVVFEVGGHGLVGGVVAAGLGEIDVGEADVVAVSLEVVDGELGGFECFNEGFVIVVVAFVGEVFALEGGHEAVEFK